MYGLEVREREIFRALKELKKCDFVIIGGYAVNVYAPPRFSIDCDLVLREKDAGNVGKVLEKMGYERAAQSDSRTPYHGTFTRFEKAIEKGFKVSFDLLIDKVVDRQTGAVLTADWVFDASSAELVRGKTALDKITAKVPTVDALIVMKLLSCRKTDIRDIFMMISRAKDFSYIRNEVSKRAVFHRQFAKLREEVISKDFKNNLQGVFGYFQESLFNKHKELILKLGEQ